MHSPFRVRGCGVRVPAAGRVRIIPAAARRPRAWPGISSPHRPPRSHLARIHGTHRRSTEWFRPPVSLPRHGTRACISRIFVPTPRFLSEADPIRSAIRKVGGTPRWVLVFVDVVLDDRVFFAPFAAYFDARIGRPSVPMETY